MGICTQALTCTCICTRVHLRPMRTLEHAYGHTHTHFVFLSPHALTWPHKDSCILLAGSDYYKVKKIHTFIVYLCCLSFRKSTKKSAGCRPRPKLRCCSRSAPTAPADADTRPLPKAEPQRNWSMCACLCACVCNCLCVLCASTYMCCCSRSAPRTRTRDHRRGRRPKEIEVRVW